MFNLFLFKQTYYMTWPIAARSMQLQFFPDFDVTSSGCYLHLNVHGCRKDDFAKPAAGFFPPKSKIVANLILRILRCKIMYRMTKYLSRFYVFFFI